MIVSTSKHSTCLDIQSLVVLDHPCSLRCSYYTDTFGLFEREFLKDCDTSLMDNLVNKMNSRETFTKIPGWLNPVDPTGKKTHKIVTHKLLTCQSSVTNGDSPTLWGELGDVSIVSTRNNNQKNPTWSSRGFSNPKIFQFPFMIRGTNLQVDSLIYLLEINLLFWITFVDL